MTVVYDGGGGIVASLGLDGIAPHHRGHGDARLFREQMESLTDDFTVGLLTWCEYGQVAERFAREYAGWSE